MAQILQISIGQAGCNIGYSFWNQISLEHGISADGKTENPIDKKLEKVNTYFTENSKGDYISTGFFIDTDPDYRYNRQFAYQTLLQTIQPLKFNLGQDKYREQFCQRIEKLRYLKKTEDFDPIRKQIEKFDHFLGFEFTHSISGGTGSGTFQKLHSVLDNISTNYSTFKSSFTVFPHQDYQNNVFEYYNALLTIPTLLDDVVSCICFDNTALFKSDILQSSNKNYESANKLVQYLKKIYFPFLKQIVQTMSAMSSSQRFPGQLNASYKKILTNLLPYPRQHFLVSSVCPSLIYKSSKISSVQEQLNFVTSPENILLSHNKKDTPLLASMLQIRGSSVSTWEVENSVNFINNQKKENEFLLYNLSRYSVGYSNKTSNDSQLECISISNSYLVKQSLLNIRDQSKKMQLKKCFLWKFKELGLEESQLDEAQSYLEDIMAELNHNHFFDQGMEEEEEEEEHLRPRRPRRREEDII